MKLTKIRITLIIISLLLVAITTFCGVGVYKEASKKEQRRQDRFSMYMTAWIINQNECDKMTGKTGFIISLIKEFDVGDAMQLQWRTKKRNKLVKKAKEGTITTGERLELSNRQPDMRDHPTIPIKLFDLFMPSRFDAISMAVPFTQIGKAFPYDGDFIIAYDDGYTRWQADVKHWYHFVSHKYHVLKKNRKINTVLEKLEENEKISSALFEQGRKEILSMTRKESADYFISSIGKEYSAHNVTGKELQDFLFTPERLSMERREEIIIAFTRPKYLELKCQNDYKLLFPKELF